MSQSTAQNANSTTRVKYQTLQDVAKAAPFTSDVAAFVAGQVVVQITGTASGVTVQVQRSDTDPAIAPNWAPADAALVGAASGMSPALYAEPSFGWWRINCTVVTGGVVNTSISGATA